MRVCVQMSALPLVDYLEKLSESDMKRRSNAIALRRAIDSAQLEMASASVKTNPKLIFRCVKTFDIKEASRLAAETGRAYDTLLSVLQAQLGVLAAEPEDVSKLSDEDKKANVDLLSVRTALGEMQQRIANERSKIGAKIDAKSDVKDLDYVKTLTLNTEAIQLYNLLTLRLTGELKDLSDLAVKEWSDKENPIHAATRRQIIEQQLGVRHDPSVKKGNDTETPLIAAAAAADTK